MTFVYHIVEMITAFTPELHTTYIVINEIPQLMSTKVLGPYLVEEAYFEPVKTKHLQSF